MDAISDALGELTGTVTGDGGMLGPGAIAPPLLMGLVVKMGVPV